MSLKTDGQPQARPCVKWAGGKTRLLPEILRRLPAKINTYFEPFVGGGAVFFALAAEKRFKRAALNDSNAELITTYAALKAYPQDVIARLRVRSYDEQEYYAVRSLNPLGMKAADVAARFIYLNRTGFNGLYRVNRKGEFNVPFGRYTNPTICDAPNLLAVSKALQGTNLTSVDFVPALMLAEDPKKGDACYIDPPYFPVSDTANFTSYTAGGFKLEDQIRLRDLARRLVDRGVHVLLSNSDTPVVRDLYRGFRIERVEAPRRINSKGGARGNVGELLIRGVP